MKVFLTGSTGFVGSYVLQALLDADHDVRALVRPGSEKRLAPASDAVEIAPGDVTDASSLAALLDGCEAVVHLVGIIREDVDAGATFERVHLGGARNVIDAATAAGVQRFVLMSANGAKPRRLYFTSGLYFTSMGIERSRIGAAFGALNHVFGGDLRGFAARRLFCLSLAFSIDASQGLEAVPDDHDKGDQDEEFRWAETEHCRSVAILDIVLVVVRIVHFCRFGFHPAHRLEAVPDDRDKCDQDEEFG